MNYIFIHSLVVVLSGVRRAEGEKQRKEQGACLVDSDYQLKQKNKDTNQTRNSFSALDSASTSGNHNDDSIIVGEVIADPLDDARSESSDDMENVYDETLDANVQLKQSGASTPHKKVVNV
ncbi:hypothetical protein Tco_1542777 [Tanacetum coccineum]